MGLWSPKEEAILVDLLHVDSENRPKTREILYAELRNRAPYKGICRDCKVQKFTDARIYRKAVRLINEVNKKLEDKKGVLSLPPSDAEIARAGITAQAQAQAPAEPKDRTLVLRDLLANASKKKKQARNAKKVAAAKKRTVTPKKTPRAAAKQNATAAS